MALKLFKQLDIAFIGKFDEVDLATLPAVRGYINHSLSKIQLDYAIPTNEFGQYNIIEAESDEDALSKISDVADGVIVFDKNTYKIIFKDEEDTFLKD